MSESIATSAIEMVRSPIRIGRKLLRARGKVIPRMRESRCSFKSLPFTIALQIGDRDPRDLAIAQSYQAFTKPGKGFLNQRVAISQHACVAVFSSPALGPPHRDGVQLPSAVLASTETGRRQPDEPEEPPE
jgi:hypothetical protein